MTEDQQNHIDSIVEDFAIKATAKYEAGAKEHGPGAIWDLSSLKLIDSALEEAIDQYVYLYTLKEKLLEK